MPRRACTTWRASRGCRSSTVSNVLNHPQRVKAATRERVEAAVAELGFVRNQNARALVVGATHTIGLVVFDLRNSLFVDIASGAQRAARARRYSLQLGSSESDVEQEAEHLAFFDSARVSGVLLAPMYDARRSRRAPASPRASRRHRQSRAVAHRRVLRARRQPGGGPHRDAPPDRPGRPAHRRRGRPARLPARLAPPRRGAARRGRGAAARPRSWRSTWTGSRSSTGPRPQSASRGSRRTSGRTPCWRSPICWRWPSSTGSPASASACRKTSS